MTTAVNYVDENDDGDALAPNAEDVDCPICLMAVPARVGVTLRDCLHSFCRDCLAHVIEFSDEAAVGCPYRDESYACPATIQQREIKAVRYFTT
jgi:RanBP-type and C3HC4-type zinc finger-containing protein 1